MAEKCKIYRQEKNTLEVLTTNLQGNILVERFDGVPSEERLHWRSFLTKLGQSNLQGAKHDELFIAYQKSVYIVYTLYGDVSIFAVGKEEYNELTLSDVVCAITTSIKDACGKPPSEHRFLDKYRKICLCLDEIFWKGVMENTDKERVKRLAKLKLPTEF